MAADLEGVGTGRQARRAADRDRRPVEDVQASTARRARAGRRLGCDLARRDARARRRVRLRQDDVRAQRCSASSSRRAGSVELDGRSARADAREAHDRRRARRCRSCSRTRTRRSTAAGPCGASCAGRSRSWPASRARRPTSASATLSEAVRLPNRAVAATPGAALGRPEAARRDRARVRRRAAHRRLRRADLGARRLGAGRDPQPARRAAGRARHQLPVHLPRPRRGALPRRPHRGDVPRAHHGGRRRPRPCSAARTIRTPRRCCRPCPRSTASSASGSGSKARSRAPPTRPRGCVFHTRCPRKLGAICESEEPPLVEVEPAHHMRCHIPIEELREMQLSRPGQPVAGD